MTYYRYNALDIAAYFKWTSMPAETERIYLDLLFQMRENLLARPLAKDFESFSQAVFREMYHVWARGFESEFSDINLIAPEGSTALICDQGFLALESYMKLLTIHLILTENLPYVRIYFVGLPLLLGIDKDYADFERNVALAAETLRLHATDSRGNDFDLSLGLPNEALCLSLNPEYRKVLFGSVGYRVKRTNDYQEKMRILREKSRRDIEAETVLRSAQERRKDRRRAAALASPSINAVVTTEQLPELHGGRADTAVTTTPADVDPSAVPKTASRKKANTMNGKGDLNA